MANLVGLTVARNTMAGFDIRKEGLQTIRTPMTFYGSVETHSSIAKAVESLGVGSDCLRRIPVDADFQIIVSALEAAVLKDRREGYHPVCVIGNAGTVNTGAIDDLSALADFCQREQLWFHIDGAFGALAALSPDLRLLGKRRAGFLQSAARCLFPICSASVNLNVREKITICRHKLAKSDNYSTIWRSIDSIWGRMTSVAR